MASKRIAFAAAGLIAAVSACVAGPPAPSRAAPAAPAPHACYWLSNEGEGWVARPDLSSEFQCFEMDSCSGGLGGSGGGCYKWALGRDEPAQPWSNAVRGKVR